MNEHKMRFIVVGMGNLSNVMLNVLTALPWYGKTTAVVDIRQEALAKAKDRLGLTDDVLFTDFHAAITQRDADVALINTGAEWHYTLVKAALKSGLHVLVAKPLANTYEQAVELVELAAMQGVTLCVGAQMRYNRHYTALQKFVTSGMLGQVEMVNFLNAKPQFDPLYLQGKPQPMLYDRSLLHFDALNAIFPQHIPEWIMCDGFQPSWSVFDGPCSINALIRFHPRLHIFYQGGISSQSDLYEVRLEGAKGVLRCRGIHMSNDLMRYDFSERGGTFAEHAIDSGMEIINPWMPFLEDWHNYLSNYSVADHTEPSFTGRNHLKVFAIASACVDSFDSGQPIEIAANPKYCSAFDND